MFRRNAGPVLFDTPTLLEAGGAERFTMLKLIINGMSEGNPTASRTAFRVARELATCEEEVPKPQRPQRSSDYSHGKLPASLSIGLLNNVARLRGFVNAIKRWPPQAQGVLDVGCGSFPVLAMAAAVYHPEAEINAIEINPYAAQNAAIMTNAFGVYNRIAINNADIANYRIAPGTTAAVTETFNAALSGEPGPKIVQHLHNNGVPIITPTIAELRLDLPHASFSQQIDLRRDSYANLAFTDKPDPVTMQPYVNLSASYADDLGPVLAYGDDVITEGLSTHDNAKLFRALLAAGRSGHLTYELGAWPFDPIIEHK